MKRWIRLIGVHFLSVAAIVGAAASARAAQTEATELGLASETEAAEFRRLCQVLALTSEQKEAARTLFGEWSRRVSASTTKFNEYNAAIQRRTHNQSELRTLHRDSYRKFYQYSERVRAERDRDVQLLLSEAQAQRWTLFEREVRRIDSLATNGHFSGGSFDVVLETERALGETEMSDEIAAAIEEYRIAIDRPARVIIESRRGILERYFDADMTDFDQRNLADSPHMVQGFEAARTAQAINIRHARLIMGLLTAEQAKSFESELIGTRSWAHGGYEHYRRTLKGMLAGARSLESISEAQEAALAEIEARYDEPERALSRREFDASVESEKLQTIDQLYGWGSEPDGHPAVKSAAEARKALSDQVLREVRGVLTAEQLAELGPPFVEAPETLELNFDED